MKKVSARMFFTVMWGGLCQALGCFFGLFGYKRDGKFAKCVWGLFATSGSIVMTLFALALLCSAVLVKVFIIDGSEITTVTMNTATTLSM